MSKKIGEGHAAAMARQGLHELQNAVYADSNVAQHHAEPGSFGTPTQGEIAAERRDETPAMEQPSILDGHARDAEAAVKAAEREPRQPQVPEPERD